MFHDVLYPPTDVKKSRLENFFMQGSLRSCIVLFIINAKLYDKDCILVPEKHRPVFKAICGGFVGLKDQLRGKLIGLGKPSCSPVGSSNAEFHSPSAYCLQNLATKQKTR